MALSGLTVPLLPTPLLSEAGNRVHGTTRAQPLTLFTQTEALLLQPLPDVTFHTKLHTSSRYN